MAQILYASANMSLNGISKGPPKHNSVIVATPQRLGDGSLVRIDVLTPNESDHPGVGKVRAQMMSAAFWLEVDEAVRLGEALMAAAVLVKQKGRAATDLFEQRELMRYLNDE